MKSRTDDAVLIELIGKQNEAFETFRTRHDEGLDETRERLDEVEKVLARPPLGDAAHPAAPAAGRLIDAAAPGEPLAEHVRRSRNAEPDRRVTFGSLVRAMVTGPRTDPEIRALEEGSDSAGGFSVPTELALPVIDRMRARSVLVKAGAQTVSLETDETHFLRIASDPSPTWRLEKAPVTQVDPTFGRVTFRPKSLAVLVRASRELIEDSRNVESALELAFAGSFAAAVDAAGLVGSGVDPVPLGIANDPAVPRYSMGVNGAPLGSYAALLRARQLLLAANSAEPTAAIMAPRTSTELELLADTTGQPLNRPRALEELLLLVTSHLPTDDVHGTAADAARIIVGDFTQLWIGVRTGLRVELLKELFAGTMEYGFLAHLRIDFAVAQPAAFAVVEGVTPAP